MSEKRGVLHMDHRVDLYIPSQCICGGSLPEAIRAKVVNEVKGNFDTWFGGHSEILIKGDWRLPDGTIAKEEVADIFSFCTSDSLEQHQEDVDRLAVDVANRLTQDRVLRVFDNLKVALWPNTLNALTPKKNCACRGGATVGEAVSVRPTDIGKADRLSKMLVIQGIIRSFNSVDHARTLFCKVLNYRFAKGELPCAMWPASIMDKLADAPMLLADHNGFKVLYLRISEEELRRGAGRQVIQRIYKDDPTFRGLIVVSDKLKRNWELVNIRVRSEDSKRLLLRRIRVGVEAVRTATERLAMLEIGEADEDSITAEELQRRHDLAFDVEAVTKAFFADLANWYFWALKHARFPKDAPKEKDGCDHISVIRLITRLVFCWFVREKRLIPNEFFSERALGELLVGFAPGKVSNKDSVFYRAILQNLFFATLNTEMAKRDWRRPGQDIMTHSLYRHKNLFARPNEALALFSNIPFLNGGLFECLDKVAKDKSKIQEERVDGFSDRGDIQPTVPDFLFFGVEREVDLSKEYGDKKFKKVKVRGLIHTLKHYRFTVEESTPFEEEVALDPELAGKIFENLLAAYNPETGVTARKQTGSFYTPREIVNYMVDEVLLAYLHIKVKESCPDAAEIERRLRHLFSFEDDRHSFAPTEVAAIIAGIDQLKVLDPAVGSGAFPMGILHKLVFILGRLDPQNEMWKERQKQRLREAMSAAGLIEDTDIRENTLRELEKQVTGIDEAFKKNTLDYGRKLYLIENCLYGVDIQPIAVQIAKMRFFISLIADQKVDPSVENFGVRPLPNLETKIVAANTLVPIDKPKQMPLGNPRIKILAEELKHIRERHFRAPTPASKSRCREQDQKLRAEISELLKKDGWDIKAAKQLAGWDPYNQNASSMFFDSEWMFEVRSGFDVVIGNPPYVRVDDISLEWKQLYNQYYRTTKGKYDLYYLFIERGFDLLKKSGVLAYITPNKYCAAISSRELREIMSRRPGSIEIVSTSRLRVFEDAANYPIISLCNSLSDKPKLRVREAISLDALMESSKLSYMLAGKDWESLPDRIIPINVSQSQVNLALRLCRSHSRLGDYIGFSEGLRIPASFESETKSSHMILKQYQFEKWTTLREGTWISAANLKKVLSEESERWQRIVQQKIVLAEDALTITATIDDQKTIPQGGVYFGAVTRDDIDLKYILGILNSKLASVIYEILFGGMHMGGGYMRYRTAFLEKLPIPNANRSTQAPLVSLVMRILSAKKKDPAADVSAWEREIDEIVYRLYGLTKDEIKILEEGE